VDEDRADWGRPGARPQATARAGSFKDSSAAAGQIATISAKVIGKIIDLHHEIDLRPAPELALGDGLSAGALGSQLRNLGRSSMATFYGIASLHEARAYLAHSLLGPRLDRCTRIVLDLEDGSLHHILAHRMT
jgi:hypothetical protein